MLSDNDNFKNVIGSIGYVFLYTFEIVHMSITIEILLKQLR